MSRGAATLDSATKYAYTIESPSDQTRLMAGPRKLRACDERLTMTGGAIPSERTLALRLVMRRTPCAYQITHNRSWRQGQPCIHASTHLQFEPAHIRQLRMREWDGTNRQCAEGGDGRYREGNRHQSAA
jgi:hypothetical protein